MYRTILVPWDFWTRDSLMLPFDWKRFKKPHVPQCGTLVHTDSNGEYRYLWVPSHIIETQPTKFEKYDSIVIVRYTPGQVATHYAIVRRELYEFYKNEDRTLAAIHIYRWYKKMKRNRERVALGEVTFI